MTRPLRPSDPLAGTELLLVDANNLIHALGRIPGAPPAPALVAHLRNLIPTRIAIELVFDGRAERGMRGTRVAAGLEVRYAGPRTADAVIVDRVSAEFGAGGPVATAAILVITDDRGLRDLVHARGARTAGASWLGSRLAGPASRPPSGPPQRSRPAGPIADDDEDGRTSWKSGRGATTKHGNPCRAGRPRRPPSAS